MKKIMIFMALVAIVFTSSLNAQFAKRDTCPCPAPVIHYPVKETSPKPVVKKIYIPAKKTSPDMEIMNSFNVTNTVTNNYYPTPLRSPEERNNYFYGNDWLAPLLLILFILALIFALIHFNNKNQSSNNPVTVNIPLNPPAPKPSVVVPVSENELKDAINKAQNSGAAFMRHKDGSYSINFHKPEEPVAEKKEDAVDLIKDQAK